MLAKSLNAQVFLYQKYFCSHHKKMDFLSY
jgi:hypothetical protein